MRFAPTHTAAAIVGPYNPSASYRIEVPPSTPLIQTVRSLAAQGGGVIHLGPYTYTITGTMNLLTGVSIVGIPGATVIKKTTGDGPVVRVFTGARLEDCEVELSRTDGSAYTTDENPAHSWENSVVHLCEPFFQDRTLPITSDPSNGWQGTKYGAATISGCVINQLVSKTRGIYVSKYGVLGDTGLKLPGGYVNVRIINNTVIPPDSREYGVILHSSIYFFHGRFNGVCLGNICTAGEDGSVVGTIRYDGDSVGANDSRICFGGAATGITFNLLSSNCAKYVATLL
jgi:hypothetical protein